jgi:(S)-citramalyl-CoA lyase
LSKFGVCPCQAPQDLPLAGFFTPGTWPNRFAKAAEIGADVLIIDLEDAVAPDDKPAARETALDFASQRKETANAVAIRINGLDTRAGIADVDALLASDAAPDYLVLPKTESAGHLQILDRLLTTAKRRTRLVGLIESNRGLAAVEAIAGATPRLAGLMLGAADMAADLGAATAWAPLAHARSRLVLACALAGVIPIDSPFFDVHDAKGLASEAADAVAFGFPAKAAIHPGQVGAINDALTPTPEAVKHAQAVLAANTKGVGVVDGQMIDEAVARKARRILAAAGQ